MAEEKTDEQVIEMTEPEQAPSAAQVLENSPTTGLIDNSNTQQANPAAPAEPVGGTIQAQPTQFDVVIPDRPVGSTTLQRKIQDHDAIAANGGIVAEAERILLIDQENADLVTEGSVVVYALGDSGSSNMEGGLTLLPGVHYGVPEDIPVHLARRLVLNRQCALSGSALDPYLAPAS